MRELAVIKYYQNSVKKINIIIIIFVARNIVFFLYSKGFEAQKS